MARKGGTKQLKKLASPISWPIQRKNTVWTVRPIPGAHPAKESIPLQIVLTEMLRISDTSNEAKKIIKGGEILIDGEAVKEPKRSVGIMDILSIPKIKKSYRVLYTEKGKIMLEEIDEKETKTKLCRIKRKTMTKGKKLQLTMHDGKNILVKKDEYKTGDTVKITIPGKEIKDHFSLAKGNIALITGGKHSGDTGKIVNVEAGNINKGVYVLIKTKERELLTPKAYVFVVGKEKAEI